MHVSAAAAGVYIKLKHCGCRNVHQAQRSIKLYYPRRRRVVHLCKIHNPGNHPNVPGPDTEKFDLRGLNVRGHARACALVERGVCHHCACVASAALRTTGLRPFGGVATP